MTIGLNAAVAAAFRSLQERVVRMPWIHPDGSWIEVTIRPHDDPAYQAKLKEAGVVPASVQDRERRRPQPPKSPLAALNWRPSEDEQAIAEALDREQEEVVRIGFDWQTYLQVYTLAEVESVRHLVAQHLVAAVHVCKGDERRPAAAEEVLPWLTSDVPIPRALPAAEKPEDEESVQRRGAALIEAGKQDEAVELFRAARAARAPRQLYLAGVAEGTAAAAYILRESVKTELFLERIRPLASASASSEAEPDTPRAEPVSPPRSAPGSRKGSGAAKTAPARAVA